MTSTSETRRKVRVFAAILAVNMLALLVVAGTTVGSPVSDIPDGMNDALFDGSNLFATQAILTAMVMMAAGLVLAVMKLNYIAVIIVLLAVLGALTAIGWAPPILILLSAMVIVGMFVKSMVEYMTGLGGSPAGK